MGAVDAGELLEVELTGVIQELWGIDHLPEL
jgi:hypothetical protein